MWLRRKRLSVTGASANRGRHPATPALACDVTAPARRPHRDPDGRRDSRQPCRTLRDVTAGAGDPRRRTAAIPDFLGGVGGDDRSRDSPRWPPPHRYQSILINYQ
ncbi:uncharacterized protein LOC143433838 [Arvicanthis niloticus]|uniref:uncharacterized protein LOC143433838 n=1 Tax=Arvicanthis niloticus TaxID=61156 RepID=UPI00402B1CF8